MNHAEMLIRKVNAELTAALNYTRTGDLDAGLRHFEQASDTLLDFNDVLTGFCATAVSEMPPLEDIPLYHNDPGPIEMERVWLCLYHLTLSTLRKKS